MPINLKLWLIFYPVFIVGSIPREFIRGSINFAFTIKSNLHKSLGYYPDHALNNLFYLTEWLNLQRFGRGGVSKIVGLGNYSLRSWFFLSKLSLGIFVKAGALVTYICSLLWVFSFSIWWQQVELLWLMMTTGILLFSVHTFAMSFVRQNYQIISWIFVMPMFYFGLSGDFVLFFLTATLMAEAGITAYVLSLPVILFIAKDTGSLILLILYLIAAIPIAWRLRFYIGSDDFKKSILEITSLIGAKNEGIKYSRDLRRWDFPTIYFCSLYFAVFIFISIVNGGIQYYLAIGAFSYYLNQKVMRIADEESLMMLNSTLAMLTVLSLDKSYINLVAFWLVVNPLPFLLGIQSFDASIGVGPIRKPTPFDQERFVSELDDLIKDVKPGDKIMCAFPDPGGKYKNLFNGYRIIHEVTLNAAARRNIHCMPDWWAVSETNYLGAPEIWGDTPTKLLANCRYWKCSYAILYNDQIRSDDLDWLEYFDILNSYDWTDDNIGSADHRLWPSEVQAPVITLLKVKDFA